MPPTQCILSGGIRSATKLSSSVASTKCRSLGGPKGPRGPRGPRGPKGPKGPKGAFGALEGGWAHGDLWSYSEAIPNGKTFRIEGY